MKTRLSCIALALVALCAHSQGVFEYTARLSGSNAVPPNSSSMTGEVSYITIDGTGFHAWVNPQQEPRITGVEIYRSTDPVGLGTKVFDFTRGFVPPGPNGEPESFYYVLDTTLTAPQRNDLDGGLWWLTVSTTTFPNGELRGQITSVPEPSTCALLGLGVLTYCAFRGRRDIVR
jgi:hypothetical protein